MPTRKGGSEMRLSAIIGGQRGKQVGAGYGAGRIASAGG